MSTQGDLASLDRILVSLPDWQYSVLAAVALGAVAGVPFFDGHVLPALAEGALYVGVPTVATSVVTYWLDSVAGGDLTLNRSSVLALVCEAVVLALWFPAWIAAVVVGYPVVVLDVVVAGLAFIVGVRALVLAAVSRRSLGWTAAMAATQSALALVLPALAVAAGRSGSFLAASHVPDLASRAADSGSNDLGALVLLSVLYVLATYAILRAIDRPVRQSLEVTSLDFAHSFFRYLSGQPGFLESFFEEFGDDVLVPVTATAFYREDGSEKARFVVPTVHPGPMGDVGGGRLPVKLAAAADGTCFPYHATAGHDFNPVSQAGVDAIVDAADRALEDASRAATATPAVRAREGEAQVVGQRLGDGVFAAATFAPEPADDVDYGVGLVMEGGLRAAGDHVVLADAHNSNDGTESREGFRHVTAGSHRANELADAAEAAGNRLGDADEAALRLGVASSPTEWDVEDGVGPLGVRVAVVEAGGHRTAYVLADANNANIGLRDRVRDALPERVDEAELLTTDTHLVTQTTAVNQLGQHVDADAFARLAADLVADAVEDLEPVTAGGGTTTTPVQVFGNGRTEHFASLANIMVVVGLSLFGLALVTAVAVSVVVFALVS